MNKVIRVEDDLLCIMDTFWPYSGFFFPLSAISCDWSVLSDVLGRRPVADTFSCLSGVIKTSCVIAFLRPS